MIELRFVAPDLRRLDEAGAEVVCCGVWKDERPLTGLAGLLDWRLAGRLSNLLRGGFLVGDVGEALVAPARPRLMFDKLLVVGLGPRAAFGDVTFRRVLERTVDVLAGLNTRRAFLELPGRGDRTITPERAAEIMLDVVGEEERDGIWFVEDSDGQRGIEERARERYASAARSVRPGA